MKDSLLGRGIFTTLFMLAGVTVFCQNSKTPLDKGFIDKTISYYYGKQLKLHPGKILFYIEKDSFNMNARTDYGLFKVQFVSKEEAATKIGKASQTGQIDRIVVKWVSLDTIDVAITRCSINVRKDSKIIDGQKIPVTETSISGCIDANVEIPTCQFVYSPSTSAWAQLDEGKLVKRK